MLCYVMLCYMLYVMLCYVILRVHGIRKFENPNRRNTFFMGSHCHFATARFVHVFTVPNIFLTWFFLSQKTTDTKKDLLLHPGHLSPMRNGIVWALVTFHISERLITAWKQHDWAMRPEGWRFPCAHTSKIFGEVFQLSYINTDRLQDYTGFKRQTCLCWRFPQRRIV